MRSDASYTITEFEDLAGRARITWHRESATLSFRFKSDIDKAAQWLICAELKASAWRHRTQPKIKARGGVCIHIRSSNAIEAAKQVLRFASDGIRRRIYHRPYKAGDGEIEVSKRTTEPEFVGSVRVRAGNGSAHVKSLLHLNAGGSRSDRQVSIKLRGRSAQAPRNSKLRVYGEACTWCVTDPRPVVTTGLKPGGYTRVGRYWSEDSVRVTGGNESSSVQNRSVQTI